CGRQFDWTLVPEYAIKRPPAKLIKVDGALLDTFRLTHGFWEAKDEHDDLEREIRRKLEQGYPRNNIIFQGPERAVLIQNGVRQGLPDDIRDSDNLVELLKTFFAYREPHHEEWDEAVAEFKVHIPEIAEAVQEKIEEQQRTNPAFVERFKAFYEVCRQSINPNLSVEAVERMLVQHLLTERIFQRIFDNPDFTRRNVIAVEIEKVIESMTAKQFSRNAFLKDLDRFYKAIELAADNTEDYSEKQHFINTVYERFFQGYSPKEADTHGIVYTPQPIVDFMVRSVEDILQKEFGRSLSDKGVHILDPFVGTGNFITRVMKEIKTSALPYKYDNELHCNEVMLLPYYVASMNIEHEYMERTGEYKAFPGICLVDTFELAEPEQRGLSFMSEENTERVTRQKNSPIFVIIANPPYNVGQMYDNDFNANRTYKAMSSRVRDTYGRDSKASSVSKLDDAYVKAIRWASDRIGDEGIVAFVSNNGYIDQIAFDGMRKHLARDFESIYVLDLGGNVRKNPKLSGTTHNVFGIQVGVSIELLVRNRKIPSARQARIRYASLETNLRREQRLACLDEASDMSGIQWSEIRPDGIYTWLTANLKSEFEQFFAMGTKEAKSGEADNAIFSLFSIGTNSARDPWVYNFSLDRLLTNTARLIKSYNAEVTQAANGIPQERDDTKIKWSSRLRETLESGRRCDFSANRVRAALFRPYTRQLLYFDSILIHRRGRLSLIFPTQQSELENLAISLSGLGSEKPFMALVGNALPDFHLTGAGCTNQCFPFYQYDEDGSNRRENITDWALDEFRKHYDDPSITKWDIFHYVYAVLHHPAYRSRYAANLKRELPRIPFVGTTHTGRAGLQASVPAAPPSSGVGLQPDGTAPIAPTVLGSPGLQAGENDGALGAPSLLPKANAQPQAERQEQIPQGLKPLRDDKSLGVPGRGAEAPLYATDREVFHAFAEAGRKLADLHVNYEQQPEYLLERVENPKEKLNWRVEKMRLSKDKTTLVYNDFLTLKGIPPEAFEYRLGNRSALEWVIDQYQVSTDKRSGIINDPNRADDPEYIVRPIGQVITVSLETMKIVNALPPLVIDTETPAHA
ncbi:MAG: type ISP restriction/modification enzyme, partial [Candidatus Korobacteraceae bacterium]